MPSARRSSRTGASPLLHRPGFVGALARFWQKSYASDYLVLLALLALQVLGQLFVEPFHRMFTLDNVAIQYPHAELERVPPIWLLIHAAGIPLLVITAWAIVVRPPPQKVHVTYLGLLLSLLATGFLTEMIKNTVGRPRPDLLSRCKPRDGTDPHALQTVDVCTETQHHLLHDGWRSFPSGHSSFAFAGLGYLALFLAAQTHALHPHTPLPLAVLPLVPLCGALLIAISRTEDYRHDVFDVTTGSVLGALLALASYRRYYPSLWRAACAEPFGYPGDQRSLHRAGYAKAPAKDAEMAAGAPNVAVAGDSDEDDDDGGNDHIERGGPSAISGR